MGIEDRIETKIDALTKSHADLRVEVASIGTKMDKLVGEDGNNGTMSILEARVGKVEARQIFVAGGSAVVGLGVGAFLGAVFKKLMGVS